MKKIGTLLTAVLFLFVFLVNYYTPVSAIAYYVYNGFKYHIEDGMGIIDEYQGTDANVVVPSKILGDEINIIYIISFAENTNIVSVSLPDTIKGIYQSAFSDCTNLKSITIPKNCDILASMAFRNCSSLKTINIKSKLTAINESTFENCSSLERIELPDTTTSIDKLAFANCTALKYITIPESVNSIDDSGRAPGSIRRPAFITFKQHEYDGTQTFYTGGADAAGSGM